MNLLISLRSEVLKTKRTAIFYLTFAAAVLIPLILSLNIALDGIEPEFAKQGINPLFKLAFEILSAVPFPMFVVLLCTMLPQVEFRNNTWKQVFASPQPVGNVFIARFVNVHLMILTFLVIFNLCLFLIGAMVHFTMPAINFLDKPINWTQWLNKNATMYIAGLSISAIQFWLGLRFRNFFVPVGIGFVLWFIGTLLVMEFGSKYAYYFPYTALPYSMFDKYKYLQPTINMISVGYMVLFLAIGFADFRRGKR
jgi:lantibiotic transport system permease protein